MTYTLDQIAKIIVKNPNKKRIDYGKKINKLLMLHVHGEGMKEHMKRIDYFENEDLYLSRKQYAISNVDLFERLLAEEKQVFSARGGSSYFGLPDNEEKQMNALLQDVLYGVSLREWVENFGLNAYRCDPMGVIFMEVEKVTEIEGNDAAEVGAKQVIETPKCYPVYKCIQNIWDYQSNGRNLDYLCMTLTDDELEMYGIQEQTANIPQGTTHQNITYFRFVDDGQDIIVKRVNADSVEAVTLANGYKNPINGLWDKVPAFVVSDIMKFSDPGKFDTPLNKIVELADSYLNDRSIKDLQKKYHGFAKPVEPLSTCISCGGEGFVKGVPCPECTIPGTDKGTGYKLRTKISDSLKIPIDMLNADKAPRFDFKKIFGYVTPDIESVNMQIAGLTNLEGCMYITYWGCNNTEMEGFNGTQSQNETATKTVANLQPKYARLNRTADWAQRTMNAIADFIGSFWFDSFTESSIILSREYNFESPDTILATYYDMKANGVPDSMLDNQYEKYIKCLWQSNPQQLGIYLKKFKVEPFPHLSAESVEKSAIVIPEDKICKRYFGEWDDTILPAAWLTQDPLKLKAQLLIYAQGKELELKAAQKEEMQLAADMSADNKPQVV